MFWNMRREEKKAKIATKISFQASGFKPLFNIGIEIEFFFPSV